MVIKERKQEDILLVNGNPKEGNKKKGRNSLSIFAYFFIACGSCVFLSYFSCMATLCSNCVIWKCVNKWLIMVSFVELTH